MRRLLVFATLVNCLDRWYGVGPAPLHGTVGFVVLDVTSFSRLFYARMSIGPGSLADPWPHNQHLDTPRHTLGKPDGAGCEPFTPRRLLHTP